jgi:iron complex outermembrane receptor protein
MNMIIRFGLGISLAVFALTVSVNVKAQESEENQYLEEVIVYAERRGSNASKIPISLTAISEQTIQDSGIERIEDFSFMVPNLTMTSHSSRRGPRINIRGVATDPVNIGISGSVPVYIDGIVQGRMISVDTGLYDLESIEVLRGSQGTLFGRNSIGGALLFRTRKPNTEKFESSGKVGFGNNSFKIINAIVNMPVGETAALKLGVSKQQRDGFEYNETLDKDVNNMDDVGFRGQFIWLPNDQLELIARFDYADSEVDGYTPESEAFAGDVDGFDRIVHTDFNDFSSRETKGGSLEINYDLENGRTFHSLTGAQGYDSSNFRDIDMTSTSMLNTRSGPDEQDQFSQEFRITSAPNEKYDWVGGFFYFKADTKTNFGTQLGSLFTGGAPSDWLLVGLGELNTKAWSLFGHANYYLDDEWKLTAGLRWTDEEKTAKYFQNPFPAFGLTPEDRTEKNNDSELSGTIRLSRNINDNWMAFGAWSHGFKASGFNLQPSSPDDFKAEPEFLDAWEFGAKAEFNQVRFAATGFYNDYTDLQVSRFETPEGGLPTLVFGNAGKMKSKGFELELMWAPKDNLDIGATYAYLDAEFKEFETASTDLSGNIPNRSPKNSFSTFIQYEVTGLNAVDFQIRGEYVKRDEWFGTDSNIPRRFQPSMNLVNARLRVVDKNGVWVVTAWGRNLTDELHAVQFSPALFGPSIGRSWALPRTYGVDITWNF